MSLRDRISFAINATIFLGMASMAYVDMVLGNQVFLFSIFSVFLFFLSICAVLAFHYF